MRICKVEVKMSKVSTFEIQGRILATIENLQMTPQISAISGNMFHYSNIMRVTITI